MSAPKGKEISQVSQLRSSPEASPMHSAEVAPKPTRTEKKYKASAPGAHSPSRHKQRPLATRQLEKRAADAKPEAIGRNIEAESNEQGPTDQQKPLDQKYAVPEEFHSHVVSEGPRPVDYRNRRYSARRRPSLWNPMVNQAKPPVQGLTVQAAASQASYIVPNYVRAPEVPPEPRFISMQMVSIGALSVLITVAIIAWTVVTLRQSDVLKEPAGQHETGLEHTPGWSVSHYDLKHFRGSNVTTEFSGNATSSSEESTI